MYAKYAEIRDSKGLNDNKVSELTGIPKTTIADWKSGRSVPKADRLLAIANLLETTIDQFVEPYERKGE